MDKNTTKIIVQVIGTLGAVAAAYIGGQTLGEKSGEKSGENKVATMMVDNAVQQGNVTVNLQNYSSDEAINWFMQHYNESLEEITQLKGEKQELKDQLEVADQEISKLQQQQLEGNESAETEKEALNAKLKENEDEIAELKGTIEALSTQMNNEISVNFENVPVYLENLMVSSDGDRSVALINGIPYYSENILKRVLEESSKLYQYSSTRVDILSDIEASKMLVSKEEIYQIDDSVSLSSGIRTDIGGNEFSGILFTGRGSVSFLLNGQYKKMRGIVHVAKESDNGNYGHINIYKTDKDGNVTPVHESKELTKISGVDDFSNGCDIEGAVIVTIEGYAEYSSTEMDMVLSDAYFYND